ncbi:hypothetical protein ACQP1K_14860 [Sphaerimonospora sp. CA-214678]|uniref:hypothetical protein n=1 Tax=Sphaerimonospora sp. CA-214678 TaxID=3240029 RepID=UPI003D8FEE14
MDDRITSPPDLPIVARISAAIVSASFAVTLAAGVAFAVGVNLAAGDGTTWDAPSPLAAAGSDGTTWD